MDPDRWKKIKEVFAAASELSLEKRGEILTALDNGLRAEVELLLQNFDNSNGFIESPAVANFGYEPASDSMIGREIDGYKIVQQIGTGGMGSVYLADQHADGLSHRVALKVIKRGMDTNSVLKRFFKERQILANLEHPNIARFLDGGSTEDGLPFFVMEYVEGLPIKRYCFQHEMNTRQVLELFRKVCSAVSYAHQNLTVHRDLKPSNILVTRSGEPKLLDFGIAKLLNPDWSLDTSEATLTMFRVMTPEYSSPEQLDGRTVTTASDVYSLGVVLFELLTGARPFKSVSQSAESIASELQTADPPKPSSVVLARSAAPAATGQNAKTTAEDNSGSAVSDLRSEAPDRPRPGVYAYRAKELRGDIDNIILKALQREPSRRYQSVTEFSEDIRRHLEGLPVSATADSLGYRVSRFVRRHRTAVATAAAIVVVLIGATTITAWQAYRAEREKARAEQRFNDVRRLANSFMFDFHDAIKDLPGSTEARSLVVTKALEYLEILAAENPTDPTLQYELGAAFSKVGRIQGSGGDASLGESKAALQSYKRATDLLEPLVKAEPNNVKYVEELAVAYIDMGFVTAERGDIDEFLAANKRATELYERLIDLAPERSDLRATISTAYKGQGDYISSRGNLDEALRWYRKASDSTRKILEQKPDDDYTVSLQLVADEAIAATLGNPNYTNLGSVAESTEAYRQMSELSKRQFDKKPDDKKARSTQAYFLENLGLLLGLSGDWSGALAKQDEAIALQRPLVDADKNNAVAHWRMANMLTDRGQALSKLKRFDESFAAHRQALAIYQHILEKDPENGQMQLNNARSLKGFANALAESGRYDEARTNYEKSIAINQPMADDDAENMDIRWALADDYAKLGYLYFAVARNTSKREDVEKGLENLRRALAVNIVMRDKGLLIKPVLDAIASLQEEIAKSESALS